MTHRVLQAYEGGAARLRDRFDKLRSEDVLAPVLDLLPAPPARVLDVGAGSGRDVAWFDAQGHDVEAAEPVAAFHEAIGARVPRIRIHPVGLPSLDGIEGPYDLILVSGVWHHLSPQDRTAATARLADLLAPGGRAILSLRHGGEAHGGMVTALDPADVLSDAEAAALTTVLQVAAPSVQAQNVEAGVTWTWLVLERPR